MSEQFPASDEFSIEPPHGEFVDVRETEQWGEFIDDMHKAEAAMLPYDDPTDSFACELSAKHSIELSDSFGYEYNGQPSRVVGLAYSDTAPGAPVVFDMRRATFHGCDLKFINDRWQAAFEFYTDGNDSVLPMGSYFIPVDKHHILELKIRADFGGDDEELEVVELLHQQAEAAQEHVTSGDFATTPADAQRQVLRNICDSADSDFPRNKRDVDVIIYCSRYYTRYDDMPGFDVRDFLTDSTAPEQLNEFSLPQGMVDGYEYPELDTLPANQALVAWNFDIAAGAPCLVVRNEIEARTHYVPLPDIKDVI